jgi:hypothetical protein
MIRKFKLLFLFASAGIFSGVNLVQAQVISDPEQQPLIRLLREFSVFINLVLVIMVLILAISLHGALKYLGGKDSWKNKIRIIWHFLSKEPAQLFSQKAQRDKTGTYLLPFESYRRLHNMTQKTFLRALGLIVVQISLIIFLIYGLSLLGHYTSASGAKSLESNNFILQLDK